MITRSITVMAICCSFFIMFQIIVSTTAMRTGIDEFTRDQKNRKRHNYLEESVLDNDLFDNIDEKGPIYNTKSFDRDENDELPSFMVDYANMIRNDIILLDNSVETRTRKRGNIKVEKHNQAMPNIPCNCELSNETKDLGENTFPRYIENRTCSQEKCAPLYICKPTISYLTLLRKRKGISLIREYLTQADVPSDFRNRWYAEERPVIIGCVCISDYRIPLKRV